MKAKPPTESAGKHGSGLVLTLPGVLFLASATAGLVAAQTSAPPRTVWDGVYTEAQAKRGTAGYQEQCSFCHLADLSGEGFAPALIDDTFTHRDDEGALRRVREGVRELAGEFPLYD